MPKQINKSSDSCLIKFCSQKTKPQYLKASNYSWHDIKSLENVFMFVKKVLNPGRKH